MRKEDQIRNLVNLCKVSRETISILKKYESILIKANKTLNLIGKSTIKQIWHRHILDSYQIIDFIENFSLFNFFYEFLVYPHSSTILAEC